MVMLEFIIMQATRLLLQILILDVVCSKLFEELT